MEVHLMALQSCLSIASIFLQFFCHPLANLVLSWLTFLRIFNSKWQRLPKSPDVSQLEQVIRFYLQFAETNCVLWWRLHQC